MGRIYFRRKSLTDNTKGIYDFVENDLTRYPALVPVITWQHNTSPVPPTRPRLDSTKVTLSWSGTKDHSDAPYLVYNVYASRQVPVDIHDARNIVAVCTPSTPTRVPTVQGMAYVATAVDCCGNESEPLQTHQKSVKITRFPPVTLLPYDGLHLQLSDRGQTLDALFVPIESLQDTMVTTRVHQGKYADVPRLPEGMYVPRFINRKGYRHRPGHSMVKRSPNL